MAEKKLKRAIIFGWLLIIWGILSAVLGYFESMITIHYGGRKGPYPMGVDILVSLLAGLPYSLFLLIVGIGLKKLKSWARNLTLFILVPFYCIFQPIRYFYLLGFNNIEKIKFTIKTGSWPENMCPMLIPFLFGLFLFIYFISPAIKDRFK
ncbi:MAG: hypothetical protein M0R48_00195 [Candidatus Omnitrophica bacterium]|jgi:hypothetical protein|nr:hypothetical protein [Candidatus Omnitrophota bacterium]